MSDESRYAALVDGLLRGEADLSELNALGLRNATRAAGSFRGALDHADLTRASDRWLRPLLESARPAFGAEILVELADAVRANEGVALAPEHWTPLIRVIGNSTFLARLLVRHPEWRFEIDAELPGAPDYSRSLGSKFARRSTRDSCASPRAISLSAPSGRD